MFLKTPKTIPRIAAPTPAATFPRQITNTTATKRLPSLSFSVALSLVFCFSSSITLFSFSAVLSPILRSKGNTKVLIFDPQKSKETTPYKITQSPEMLLPVHFPA
jgi:hypothetical protein